MADGREPPPQYDDDDKEMDNDDLFTSASEKLNEKAENGQLEDENEDLFAGSEVCLNDEEPAVENSSSAAMDGASATLKAQSITASAPVDKPKHTYQEIKTLQEQKEEEQADQFKIDITITEPKKVGEGMGSYMAYKVFTRTNIPDFRHQECSVYRRFSDFLGLYEKLVNKFQHYGYIIPPPPEKSVVGSTRIKMSKEDQSSAEFIGRRRASLERFMNRLGKHPVLRTDIDFRDFLEQEGDLPKATNTAALSGAGVMRLFSKVGDQLGSMTYKMDETDAWFEEKHTQVENLDIHLKKLHASVEALVVYRKELAVSTGTFAKSCAMLGNAEEHTALSRAMSQLAEVEEKIDQVHMDQADRDFYVLAELIKDYISLVGAVKDAFRMRVKIFKNWKDAEVTLRKKRENKAKLELAHKNDKIPQAQQEIQEWEQKVDKGQEDFENISKTLKKEVARFELQRIKDFKSSVINYLENLMNTQQQLVKSWETFLPEAKAIA